MDFPRGQQTTSLMQKYLSRDVKNQARDMVTIQSDTRHSFRKPTSATFTSPERLAMPGQTNRSQIHEVVSVETVQTLSEIVNVQTVQTLSEIVSVETMQTVLEIVKIETMQTLSEIVKVETVQTLSEIVNVETVQTRSELLGEIKTEWGREGGGGGAVTKRNGNTICVRSWRLVSKHACFGNNPFFSSFFLFSFFLKARKKQLFDK